MHYYNIIIVYKKAMFCEKKRIIVSHVPDTIIFSIIFYKIPYSRTFSHGANFRSFRVHADFPKIRTAKFFNR